METRSPNERKGDKDSGEKKRKAPEGNVSTLRTPLKIEASNPNKEQEEFKEYCTKISGSIPDSRSNTVLMHFKSRVSVLGKSPNKLEEFKKQFDKVIADILEQENPEIQAQLEREMNERAKKAKQEKDAYDEHINKTQTIPYNALKDYHIKEYQNYNVQRNNVVLGGSPISQTGAYKHWAEIGVRSKKELLDEFFNYNPNTATFHGISDHKNTEGLPVFSVGDVKCNFLFACNYDTNEVILFHAGVSAMAGNVLIPRQLELFEDYKKAHGIP